MSITAKNEARLADLKDHASMDYILADLIGISAARIMSKEVKLPSLQETYKNLFLTDEKPQEQETYEDNSWLLQKARMMDYTISHNLKTTQAEEV